VSATRDRAPRSLRVPADVGQLAAVRSFVRMGALRAGLPGAGIEDLVCAVDESVTNSIVHGYAGAAGFIDVLLEADDEALTIRITDTAPPYDPRTAPAPAPGGPLSGRRPGGYGVGLMRQLTDRLDYAAAPGGGNEVTLVKRFGPRTGGSGDADHDAAGRG
jgi:serine/threonine-protein kinase RsbW